MAYYSPTATTTLDNGHVRMHNAVRIDDSAPYESLSIDSSGNLIAGTGWAPTEDQHLSTKKYVDDELAAFSTDFLGLDDVNEADYTGHGSDFVRVNATPDGLEFVSLTADLIGAGALDIGANALTINSVEIVGADGEVNKAAVEDIKDLTSGEIDQLENIGATIISAAQWGYLGSMGGQPLESEVNDLTSAVTWANVPDVNITESSVTQHEGAITHNNLASIAGAAAGYHLGSTDYNNLTDANAQLAALHTDGSPTFAGVTCTDDIFLSDAKGVIMGDDLDYNFRYRASTGHLQLWSSDIDGSGTGGDIFTVDDGTDDVDFYGNITQVSGAYTMTDKVRAIDGDGLYLVDDGDNGIFVKDGGNVSINTTHSDGKLNIAATGTIANPHIRLVEDGDAREGSIYNDGAGGIHIVNANSSDNVSDAEIRLFDNQTVTILTANTERMRINSSGNTGFKTTNPGQIADFNSGSGNIIADGYDTHSLSCYKEDILDAPTALDKIQTMCIREWKRKPYISANEIKEAAIEQFGEKEWNKYFPEEESHRNKALINMPDCEMKTWIDNWCEQKRVVMRQEPRWQKKKYGLIAEEAPEECKAYNDNDELCGVNLENQIGLGLRAIQELKAENDALKQRVSELEQLRRD